MSKRKRETRQKVSGRTKAETNNEGFSSKAIALPKGAEIFKPKPGTSLKISIIPFEAGKGNPFAKPGELHYERTYYAHRSVGSDNDMVVCPNKTFGKKCPICEARKKLNYDTHEELVKELAPKQRQLFNVIDLKDADKGIQIWDISYHLFGKRLDLEIKNSDEDEGIEFFADPEEGSQLMVAFDEKSFGGRTFGEAESIRFRSRPPLDDETLSAAICLDNCIVDMDYKTLEKLFLQTDDEDDDEEEEDEESLGKMARAAKAKAKSKSKPVDDDDEDDDEEDDEDDEDEDEPAPKKSKAAAKPAAKAKSKAKPVEDDDEDEWDDDEDDEPAPKKSKVKTKAKPVDEDEDDEDDEPAPKKSKSKAKPVEDDEEDDDEEEAPKPKSKKVTETKSSKGKASRGAKSSDEDDEDEDEPAPKKSKSKAAAKAKPADDDDDFEWDDE